MSGPSRSIAAMSCMELWTSAECLASLLCISALQHQNKVAEAGLQPYPRTAF